MRLTIEDISNVLSLYTPVLLPETPRTAGVMLILLTEEQTISIVTTKRAASLSTYAGHFSLPGGMRDPEDHDLFATAAREVEEELNIKINQYQRIGQLDDYFDRYGDLVRPFVVHMRKEEFDKTHRISSDEIEEVYYFSLVDLEKIADDPSLHRITKRKPSYSYTQDNVFIWGLTATILVQFSNIITGQTKLLGKTTDES